LRDVSNRNGCGGVNKRFGDALGGKKEFRDLGAQKKSKILLGSSSENSRKGRGKLSVRKKQSGNQQKRRNVTISPKTSRGEGPGDRPFISGDSGNRVRNPR